MGSCWRDAQERSYRLTVNPKSVDFTPNIITDSMIHIFRKIKEYEKRFISTVDPNWSGMGCRMACRTDIGLGIPHSPQLKCELGLALTAKREGMRTPIWGSPRRWRY